MGKALIKKLLERIVSLMTTRPEFMETLLVSAIDALLNRGAAPVPAGEGNDHFLPSDDPIVLPPRDKPKPSLVGPISKVELRILRAQYNGKLFPEMYTKDNPFGLYSQSELKECTGGKQAFNRESKLWLDLSPFVKVGGKDRKLTRDEVLKRGMQYLTRHECVTAGEGVTFIHGTGTDKEGQPQYRGGEGGRRQRDLGLDRKPRLCPPGEGGRGRQDLHQGGGVGHIGEREHVPDGRVEHPENPRLLVEKPRAGFTSCLPASGLPPVGSPCAGRGVFLLARGTASRMGRRRRCMRLPPPLPLVGLDPLP